MHRRMDGEAGGIDRACADHDFAGVRHEYEIRDAHVSEAHPERVDPEVVGELGVARRDVASNALRESEAAEEAKRAGQSLLAMEALLLDGGECGRHRQGE